MLTSASGHSGTLLGARAPEGKAAIVTGSTSGIGLGIARALVATRIARATPISSD